MLLRSVPDSGRDQRASVSLGTADFIQDSQCVSYLPSGTMELTRRRGTCGSNATSSRRRCLGSIWNFWCKEAERSAVLLGPIEGLARGIYQLGTCSKLYWSRALDTRIRGATEEEAKSMKVLSKRSALFPKGAYRQKQLFIRGYTSNRGAPGYLLRRKARTGAMRAAYSSMSSSSPSSGCSSSSLLPRGERGERAALEALSLSSSFCSRLSRPRMWLTVAISSAGTIRSRRNCASD
jgi:hypothetical protein